MEKERRCCTCKQTKDIKEFGVSRRHKTGINPVCKECNRTYALKYTKTMEGHVRKIFNNQVRVCSERSMCSDINYEVEYTLEELIEFALSSKVFVDLFNAYVESGYKQELAPSFDRKNDYGNYSFDNFNAWMTAKENKDKACRDIKSRKNIKNCKSVRATCISTGLSIDFESITDAARYFNIHTSCIVDACRGRQMTSAKHTWEYTNFNNKFQVRKKTDYHKITKVKPKNFKGITS